MSTTDDTRQRSVAEILGWPTAIVPRADGTPIPYLPPTVDDMLAWLRERGYDVFFGADRTHLDGTAMLGERQIKVTLKPFKQHASYHRGRTLHAALEAAVRAVAEASHE